MSLVLEAAVAYARAGHLVFPVALNKRPLTEHGFRDATSDEGTIRTWWTTWPEAGVATPLGPDAGLVLDVDPRHGGDESLAKLIAEHGPLPAGPEAATGGGGSHHWFAWPGGEVPIAHGFLPGLDLQSAGAYVVLPPSPHASGNRYVWRVPLLGSKLPLPPPWLLKAAANGHPGTVGPHFGFDGSGKIPHGRRHDYLVSVAASVVSRTPGITFPQALAIVKQIVYTTTDDDLWPTRDRDIESAVRSAIVKFGTTAPSAPTERSATPRDFEPTELGVADRLVSRFGTELRFFIEGVHWLVWDGMVWKKDEEGRVFRLAREVVDSLKDEFAAADDERAEERAYTLWRSMSSNARVRAVMDAASNSDGIRVHATSLDADPWLLPCLNGTVDLRTGELRESKPEDLCTRVCPVEYDPKAVSRVWDAFLEKVQPDTEVRAYLKRRTGYAASGSTREQRFFVDHGGGGNGKTVFHEGVRIPLGPLCVTAHSTTFHRKRNEEIPNDLARCRGARVVSVNETGERRSLNEELVKDIAGGDTITARFLNHEFFDYRPTFKLFIRGNTRPQIEGTDEGIWRKALLTPWTVKIAEEERDKELLTKLRDEAAGILRWIVEGAIEYFRDGLSPPTSVVEATTDYRTDEDILGTFLSDCCVTKESARSSAAGLYDAFHEWADRSGLPSLRSAKWLGTHLKDRGFKQERTGVSRYWRGLELNETGRKLSEERSTPPEDGPSGPRTGPPRRRSRSGFRGWGSDA